LVYRLLTSGLVRKAASIFRGVNGFGNGLHTAYRLFPTPYLLPPNFYFLQFGDPGAILRRRRMRLRRRTLTGVTPARFGLATYSLEGCCSIQLSYGVKNSMPTTDAVMQIPTKSMSGSSKRQPLTKTVRGPFWELRGQVSSPKIRKLARGGKGSTMKHRGQPESLDRSQPEYRDSQFSIFILRRSSATSTS
jgi:hypothetical protein